MCFVALLGRLLQVRHDLSHCFITIPGLSPDPGLAPFVILLIVLLFASFLLSSTSAKAHTSNVPMSVYSSGGPHRSWSLNIVLAFASVLCCLLAAFACLVSHFLTPVAFSFESSLDSVSVSCCAFLAFSFVLTLSYADLSLSSRSSSSPCSTLWIHMVVGWLGNFKLTELSASHFICALPTLAAPSRSRWLSWSPHSAWQIL